MTPLIQVAAVPQGFQSRQNNTHTVRSYFEVMGGGVYKQELAAVRMPARLLWKRIKEEISTVTNWNYYFYIAHVRTSTPPPDPRPSRHPIPISTLHTAKFPISQLAVSPKDNGNRSPFPCGHYTRCFAYCMISFYSSKTMFLRRCKLRWRTDHTKSRNPFFPCHTHIERPNVIPISPAHTFAKQIRRVDITKGNIWRRSAWCWRLHPSTSAVLTHLALMNTVPIFHEKYPKRRNTYISWKQEIWYIPPSNFEPSFWCIFFRYSSPSRSEIVWHRHVIIVANDRELIGAPVKSIVTKTANTDLVHARRRVLRNFDIVVAHCRMEKATWSIAQEN